MHVMETSDVYSSLLSGHILLILCMRIIKMYMKLSVIARHGLDRFVNLYWCALLGHAFTHTFNISCNLWGSVVCPHEIWRESIQR
jgi:hypothetical protein